MNSEVKNEGLEVVAHAVAVDGRSWPYKLVVREDVAVEHVENVAPESAEIEPLCRHSEALAAIAERDARIAELELQLRLDAGDYNELEHSTNHLKSENSQLRAELAALREQVPVAWVHPQQLKALGKSAESSATCAVWNMPGAMPLGISLRVPLYAAPVAKQVVMPAADMFWDAENPEDSFTNDEEEIFINLAYDLSGSDGKVKIKLLRAVKLPSIEANVWVGVDSEGKPEVCWEYIDLNAADQEGGV